MDGRKRLILTVQVRGSGGQLSTALKAKKKSSDSTETASIDFRAPPPSTIISSPLASSKGKGRAKGKGKALRHAMSDVEESDGNQEMHGNGYAKDGFVVDSEDSDEDVFEERPLQPIRARPARPLGPPISRDVQAAAENDAHQFMVEDFEAEASRMAEEIKNYKNLQRPIFSLQNIRDMALKWTLSLDDMKRIPNIDAAKVESYGKTFLPLINKFHDQYKEMMGPAAAGHGIIDLVSSDDEMVDVELEEEQGENSRFFGDPEPRPRPQPQPQRSADVVAFHSNLDDMMKNSQASSSRARSSPGPKGRGGKVFGRGKKSYPRRSSGGYAKGSRSSAGVVKKKAPSRRQPNGSARSASSAFLPSRSGHGGGRGGGGSQATIGLMPL